MVVFFSVFYLEFGYLKITKGKSQFGVKEWKDYFRKGGINLIICLVFLLAVVTLARADNLVLFLIGIVIISLGSIECGKKMVITPFWIIFYVIMTLLLIYILTLFSELFLF